LLAKDAVYAPDASVVAVATVLHAPPANCSIVTGRSGSAGETVPVTSTAWPKTTNAGLARATS
jgi:hypothetical protein